MGQTVKQFRITLFVILIIFLTCSASLARAAASLQGRVTRVSDGDTVWLRVTERFEWIHVRFYGVDAPESEWPDVWPAQPFSDEAKKFVIKQAAGKQVSVLVKGYDIYGRTVGEVFIEGQSLSRQLLRHGLAWWNRKYAPDNNDFKQLEKEARAKGIGLWSQEHPVPPWEYRHEH
jgi:micrococcal nuclease